MKKTRTPALPPAVAERMAKRIFMTFEVRGHEHAHDRFIRAVRAGEVPDKEDMRIVAVQLERVLSGESFGRTFGLQEGQGRKASQDVSLRNQVICAEVTELRRDGYSLDKAAELVAQRYQVSFETVLKLHKSISKQSRQVSALLGRKDNQGTN